MRLVTLTIALALLTVGMPAIAGNAQDPFPGAEYERITDSESVEENETYRDFMVFEEDARVQAGWWGDHGYSLEEAGDTEPNEDHEPRWIHVRNADDEITIYVETHGLVVGAVDVFEFQPEDGGDFTPNCPHDGVEDLYPGDENPVVYAARLLEENPQQNDRAGSLALAEDDNHLTGNITLTLPDDDKEYLVAVYPQAASGNGTAAETFGDAFMKWQINADELSAKSFDQRAKPSLPVETDQWVGVTQLLDCGTQIPELPSAVPWPDELPPLSTQQDSPTPGDLLDTSLPGGFQVPMGHNAEGGVGDCDGQTSEGFIQVASPNGNDLTVTEAAYMFLLESDDFAQSYAQGLDAWVWDLPCTLSDDISDQEVLCFHEEDEHPDHQADLDLSSVSEDRTYMVKFYGASFTDPRSGQIELNLDDEGKICLDNYDAVVDTDGVEHMVFYVEEGLPQGAYLDFTERPPASVYSTAFCASLGSINPDENDPDQNTLPCLES